MDKNIIKPLSCHKHWCATHKCPRSTFIMINCLVVIAPPLKMGFFFFFWSSALCGIGGFVWNLQWKSAKSQRSTAPECQPQQGFVAYLWIWLHQRHWFINQQLQSAQAQHQSVITVSVFKELRNNRKVVIIGKTPEVTFIHVLSKLNPAESVDGKRAEPCPAC